MSLLGICRCSVSETYISRCVIILFCFFAPQIAVPGQSAVPRFEVSACVVKLPESEKTAKCGYLIVPEDRAVRNGATIRLPIIILKSDSPNPKPDPVLRTLGGPGASSLRMVRGRRASPWLKDRDMIIFEQRGTRYAQPTLDCPEVDAANSDSAKRMLGHQETKNNEVVAAKACYERLTRSGVDLSAYNSAESAGDIEDLRRALHIDKINLYGVSYSARLMLDVMRYFPSGIRSVVLESTLPPEVNYDEVGVDGIVRSLNELFTSCRADAECQKAYPALEKEFYEVVKRLNAHPLVVGKKDADTTNEFDVQLTGDDFVTWIVDYLFSDQPASTADAPYVIHQAYTGNYVAQFKRDGGPGLGHSSYSLGMRYSVWCSEEFPFEKMSIIQAQSIKYPGLQGYEVMSLPDICSVWKVKPAKRIANQPVRSEIPTLVLGAQYDAYTDPQWGRAVANRSKHSYYFEIPWAGHGPAFSVPCVGNMIEAFVDSPDKTPNGDCLSRTRNQFKFTIKKE